MHLTRNLRIKILAVLFALAFWVYVVNSGEKVHVFADKVDVQAFNVPEKVVVVNGNDLGKVSISVLALDQDFTDLRKGDITAYIDVAGLEIGTEHDVPVNVTINNPKVKLSKVDPAELTVKLDKSISKQIAVEVESSGSVAPDYTIGELHANESKVSVQGGESLVGQVSRVVASLKLEGNEHASLQRQVKLVPLDSNGKEVPGVTVAPANVTITGSIEQVSTTKTVGIVVDLNATSPAAGYWIKEATVLPSSVKINGTPRELAKIENVSTEKIDLTGTKADFSQKAALVIPPQFTLAPGELGTVTVMISLSSEESTREFFAGLTVANVPSGLTVSKVDPGSIKVDVTGPLPLVRSIDETKLKASIDATAAKEGVEQFRISDKSFSLPSGVTVETLYPREVQITFVAQAVVPAQ